MRKAIPLVLPIFLFATMVMACGGGGHASMGGCGGGHCGFSGGHAMMGGGCGSGFGGCGGVSSFGYGGYVNYPAYSGCGSYVVSSYGSNVACYTGTCSIQGPVVQQAVQPAAPALPTAPSLQITPTSPLPVRVPGPTSAPQDTRPAAPSMRPATFRIYVPADALVWINGHLTTTTGQDRTYTTWAQPGQTYTYNFVVQITRNGQVLQDSKSLIVQADGVYDLAFQPAPGKQQFQIANR